jgi:hypothetical protein
MELFADIFPVNVEFLPRLYVYQIKTVGRESVDRIGRMLSYRLRKKFKGHWKWDTEIQAIIADISPKQEEIEFLLKELWKGQENTFKNSLETITLLPHLKPSSQGIADFVATALLNDVAPGIDKILSASRKDKEEYYITLIAERYGWVMHGQPAVSVSIRSKLEYKDDVKTYAATLPDINKLIDLSVFDKTKPDFNSSMPITEIVGTLGESGRRERLLSFDLSPDMRTYIEEAPDDELVVKVGKNKYEYILSALGIRIRNKDYARFAISEKLQIPSEQRVQYIKPIAELIQKTGFVAKAYSSKNTTNVFLYQNDIQDLVQLRFGNNQIGTPDNVFNSIKRYGVYKPSNNKKIRLAILNTVPDVSLEKFREQLRNLFGENGLHYTLILAGEKTVDNASRATLEVAVDELGQKKPDLILGIISKEYGTGDDDEQWTLYDHFKHLTLKQNLQSQVLQPQTLKNEYALNNIALGILAKTGTIPYILGNPITYTDFIVGLDVSHRKKQSLTGTMNTAATARIYLSNGELLRYSIRDALLEGEIIPKHILQDIFPVREFAKKRIVVHRDGRLPDKEKEALLKWGKEIEATFYFVEIIKNGNPRLYGQDGQKIGKAPKGSTLKLSETEALLISSEFPDRFTATPRALRVCAYQPFPLLQALDSVLTLTLLHYGSVRPPRLPVTTYYADKISTMASKGLRPGMTDGTIPFWI